MLYYFISGELPFRADTFPELCAQVLGGAPTPLDANQLGVPAELAAVISRCLAHHPRDRYANVAELVAALAPFAPMRGQVVTLRTAGLLGVASPPAPGAGTQPMPGDAALQPPPMFSPVVGALPEPAPPQTFAAQPATLHGPAPTTLSTSSGQIAGPNNGPSKGSRSPKAAIVGLVVACVLTVAAVGLYLVIDGSSSSAAETPPPDAAAEIAEPDAGTAELAVESSADAGIAANPDATVEDVAKTEPGSGEPGGQDRKQSSSGSSRKGTGRGTRGSTPDQPKDPEYDPATRRN